MPRPVLHHSSVYKLASLDVFTAVLISSGWGGGILFEDCVTLKVKTLRSFETFRNCLQVDRLKPEKTWICNSRPFVLSSRVDIWLLSLVLLLWSDVIFTELFPGLMDFNCIWSFVYPICSNLTFRGPCIVLHVYSYNKTIEMHYFLKFIFGIQLYIFRTVSLSIIRILALYTQQYIQVMLTAC
jgi:hypothetical protein